MFYFGIKFEFEFNSVLFELYVLVGLEFTLLLVLKIGKYIE